MVNIPSFFKVGVTLALLAGPVSLPLMAQDKPGAPAATPATPATPAAPAGGLGGTRGSGAAQPASPAMAPESGRAPDAGRGPVSRAPAPDAGRGASGVPAGDRGMVRSGSERGPDVSRSRGPSANIGVGIGGSRGTYDGSRGQYRSSTRYSREPSTNVRVRIGAGGRGYYDAPRRYYRYGVRTYPRYVGTRCVVRKRLVRTGHGPRMVVRRVCFR